MVVRLALFMNYPKTPENGTFSKNPKYSISLDAYYKVLESLFFLYHKLRAIKPY